jgi:hypothetical protein
VDNIKSHLGEIKWGGEDSISLAQGRDQSMALVNAVMNLRVRSQLVASLVELSSV